MSGMDNRAVRRALVALAGFIAPVAMAAAQGPGSGLPSPRPEQVEDLPAGPGREETFAFCTACHAYRLVSNQGLSRERWDETLSWMTERHNMPALEGADRALILDYLAGAHPPRAAPAAGGFRNPFAPP